jgi:hypothetical protein
MSARRAARREKTRRSRTRTKPWYRRAGWPLALIVGVVTAGTILFWPRGPVYANYVDGTRPSVVFVWSDPTPHHPGG